MTTSLTFTPQAGYFKMAKWDREWIDAVKQIVHDKYKLTYKAPAVADLTIQANDEHRASSKKVCY